MSLVLGQVREVSRILGSLQILMPSCILSLESRGLSEEKERKKGRENKKGRREERKKESRIVAYMELRFGNSLSDLEKVSLDWLAWGRN